MKRRSLASSLGRKSRTGPTSLAVENLETRGLLATLTVLNSADSGAGSLRAAIEQANLDPAKDTIHFAPAVLGTITLLSALPDLSTAIDLQGPGAMRLTVARSGAPQTPAFRIFTVPAGAVVAISGLTMTGGVGGTFEGSSTIAGGGILNAGTLTVTGSVITSNELRGGRGLSGETASGGGIANTGSLTVAASTISGNRADGGFGDGFHFGGSGGSGFGGGVYSTGSLTVTASTISGNAATGGDGSGGNLGGHGGSGLGGGIYSTGTLIVTMSTVSGNSAAGGSGFGNGVFPPYSNSTGGSGLGGGVYSAGSLTVTASTFSGNLAAGGIGTLPGDVGGGGLANLGTAAVAASTLSGNMASAGGTILNVHSAFQTDPQLVGRLTVATSILAAQTGGTLVNRGGEIVSTGHSLFSDAPAVALSPTDLVGADPLLGPLADNGGPTLTHALLPASPALDAGALVEGLTTDQRGSPRPAGPAADIGAFEVLGPVKISLLSVAPSNGVGQPVAITATVTDVDGRPLESLRVSFAVIAGPNAGTTGTTDPADGRSDAAGRVVFTYIGAGGVGADAVVATATPPGGATFESTAVMVVWVDASGPTVTWVRRTGVHIQPTLVQLAFGEPLNPITANDLANYRIAAAGPDKRLGTADDQVVRIRSARYDPTNQTVTLRPAQRLRFRRPYLLTVRGIPQRGLSDLAGNFLNGNGQSGTDYRATLFQFGILNSR